VEIVWEKGKKRKRRGKGRRGTLPNVEIGQ
jgi:hypothetical protein